MTLQAAIVLILAISLLHLSSAEFSDEIQEFEERCLGDSVFQCQDGGCIMMDQYCDGRPDCKDESDESFCPGVHYHINTTSCNAAHEFTCHDQSRCVPNTWICNGVADCDDDSDEANCTGRLELDSSSCKGYRCSDGKCISWLWVCDGTVDCLDRMDEYNETLCRERKPEDLNKFDILNCEDKLELGDSNTSKIARLYPCQDRSFCLEEGSMCDGVRDCRDGSDEGPFCAKWPSMCAGFSCSAPATCKRGPAGPSCECGYFHTYNYENKTCGDRDECAEPFPKCSHTCVNAVHPFQCRCEEGYTADRFKYVCFAPDPAPLLFFSTRTEIRYFNLKSRQQVTVVSGLKQAHGVAFNGTHLYWVETANGHQAIVSARLDDVAKTKQTLVSLGLESPEDIAVDWLANLIYFSDAELGYIAACYADGGMCTQLNTTARHPRFVTLYPQKGEMFWADYHNRSVIMRANMDGSESRVFVDNLHHFPTGLTLDAAGERLYFVDQGIIGVRLDGRGQFILMASTFHHPYSLAVFENTVYWSDWASNSLQACDKVNPVAARRRVVASLDAPVMGLHLYHPLLMRAAPHACAGAACSDLCLLRGEGRTCACTEGRKLVTENQCTPSSFVMLPQFLVVGGGNVFTRLRYHSLGNPESRVTTFDIGRVQAMAYNSIKRILYIYDGDRKTINQISMNGFSEGKTKILQNKNLENVVDMGYDHVSDTLYFADAGRQVIEVLSLRTDSRALVYRFVDQSPVSICVIPDYGLLMVAVASDEDRRDINIDSMGLDGSGRRHIIRNGLKGPHIRLRYHQGLDYVFISDEGNGIIDYIHPTGTGRENFRQLSTTVTSLAVSDSTVFWADRRTPRLFWAGAHETAQNIRRIDMSIFPNHTTLQLQSSAPPPPSRALSQHPCAHNPLCSHICVQIAHPTPTQVPVEYYMGYICLCPPGLVLVNDTCEQGKTCTDDQVHCYQDNSCASGRRCDGEKNCPGGEDEMDCKEIKPKCSPEEKVCKGLCISNNSVCNEAFEPAINVSPNSTCNLGDFKCTNSEVCVPRWQLCDGDSDCPDSSDENDGMCDEIRCSNDEFQCTSGACVWKSWQCDGYDDCPDGSDEVNCENRTCSEGFFHCSSGECIDVKKRCDHKQDCVDYSDEEQCEDDGIEEEEPPECEDNEYICQLNTSICLPISARCNTKVECPGGTDEVGCNFACRGDPTLFQCEQEHFCIRKYKVCNGVKDCLDGSDEAAWNCPSPSPLPPRVQAPPCPHGYRCASGQCIEWREVCDQRPHCFDGSDEGKDCFTACENSTCDHSCQPTPYGSVCQCPSGYTFDEHVSKCVDVDECREEHCTQKCQNIPGSYMCSCFHGYTLRADRRSCKAIKGHMSILYVNGDTVRTAEADGSGTVYYRHGAPVTDIDYNYREQMLYVISQAAGQLVEVNNTQNTVVLTNIGQPSKVAVDWVTGNVYLVDSTPTAKRIRVCDVRRRRCAQLQRLPTDAEVTAFTLDPANNRLFYCLSQDTDSVIWGSSLSGASALELGAARGCRGLAADSFRRRLFVAEGGDARVVQMGYEGGSSKTVLSNDVHLRSPRRLALFEDHLYFLAASSFHIARCSLPATTLATTTATPTPRCTPYVYRVFDADTFVLKHESAQRGDVTNLCEGYSCSGVCVIEEAPQCICEDGTLTKNGSDCTPLDRKDMPLFNGSTSSELERAHWSKALLAALLVMAAWLLLLMIVYFFVYKPRRDGVNHLPVRFQNSTPKEGGPSVGPANEPSVEIGASSNRHEFVNPLQYVRDMWRNSFHRSSRPVGTSRLSFSVPQYDDSDTESELDNHDTKGLFPRRK